MENSFNGNDGIPTIQSKSSLFKGFLVFILTVIMLIPVPIILNMIEERQENQSKVIDEIASKWSSPQVIYGPFIQIEYHENSIGNKGEKIKLKQIAYVSANENLITSNITNSIKKRSLYQSVIYNSTNSIQSKFPSYKQMLSELEIEEENVIAVKYIFSVQDMKGFDDKIFLQSGGKNYPLNVDETSSLKMNEKIVVNDLEVVRPESKNLDLELLARKIDPLSFDFNSTIIKFNLKGSNQIRFIPSALQTNVNLTTN